MTVPHPCRFTVRTSRHTPHTSRECTRNSTECPRCSARMAVTRPFRHFPHMPRSPIGAAPKTHTA
eukprot:3247327-Pyramimonas_sp.AAC.1